MTRLKKVAESDEMDFEEIKEETLRAIKNMNQRVGEWSVRDTLTDFTSWGFYKGEMMVSIDDKMAKDICKQLYEYVENIFKEDDLYEVYEKVDHYSR